MGGRLRVLFVGAHPDDIEIGAAMLLRELVHQGHEVRLVVLSDDADQVDDPHGVRTRRREATASAGVLGVPHDRVHFLGFPDGAVRVDGAAVAELRGLLQDRRFTPDLVVTHSSSDSHNDHVEANRLAHAAVRSCVILHFSVHLSHEPVAFRPNFYVGGSSEDWARKDAALSEHVSQQERIGRVPLRAVESEHGRRAGVDRAEAFEITVQRGVPESTVWALSDLCISRFHRFWGALAQRDDIRLVYGAPEYRGSSIDWPGGAEDLGRDSLREAFAGRWYAGAFLEVSSASPVAARSLRTDRAIVLVGGALSNSVVREEYNRLAGVDWVVDFELPRRRPAYLLNRLTAERRESSRSRMLALLSLRDNPYINGGRILHVAGTSGPGTRAALEALARPEDYVQLVEEVVLSRGRSVIAEFAAGRGDDDAAALTEVLHV